ncbi:hypothetical protein ZWY2020_051036 [Hordeum vulgare]|nr:hypothetical protein ZWY2020_051036 [Hordeum vulgare]
MTGRARPTTGGPLAPPAPPGAGPRDATPPRGSSPASPASPRFHHRLLPDPALTPRLLLWGECSSAATGDPPRAYSPLPMVGMGRDPRDLAPSPVPAETGRIQAPRVKSIIVDSSRSEVAISGPDPGWTEVVRRGYRLASADPSVPRTLQGTHRTDRRGASTVDAPHTARHPLNPFAGRWFHCLSKRHRLAACRDPVHCLTCRRAGHIASRCPQNRKAKGSVRDRLGPAPRAIQLFDRLRFPPPPPTAMAPSAPSMLRHLDPSRHPRESRSTTVLSPALDQAVSFLRSHAITLSAADGVNVSSPMVVGKALEAQLSVPVHSLRVTAHHPEHFFVTFTQPAHQVNVVCRGSIRVDGASFNIIPWNEHDLATFDTLLIHVRVVIAKVPMHF